MGVDFKHCNYCDDSLYGEYVDSCIKCGNRLCTNCLINKDFESRFAYHYGYKFDSTNEALLKQLEAEGFHIKNYDGTLSYKDGEIVEDSGIQSKYCPYCSGKAIDRESVLEYLLTKYKLDINKVWKQIKDE